MNGTLRYIVGFLLILGMEVITLLYFFGHLQDEFLRQPRPFLILFAGSLVIIAYFLGGILGDAYSELQRRNTFDRREK